MSRPIPVDIVPSHLYLSQADQATLFGVGTPMTIATQHTQGGQVVYEETVEVYGRLKRSLSIRVLGPNWDRSHVEVTPTEAVFLGYTLEEMKTGNLTGAAPCTLVGPEGQVELEAGIIIPRPHLTCSLKDARELHVTNGEMVSLDVMGDHHRVIDDVLVRVHPTFRLRVELHQDYARDLWITRPTHASVRR